MHGFVLGSKLSSSLLYQIGHKKLKINLKDIDFSKVQLFREQVDKKISIDGPPVYGINTGFGFLAETKINAKDLASLQINLIRSHACGVGPFLEPEVVRALLALRIHSFLLGSSGVSKELVEQLVLFLQHDILPAIPCKGSVGASGDLAPLAHLALPLMGEGEVFFADKLLPAASVLQSLNIKPYSLKAKEGLSLINGTLFMATVGSFAICEAYRLIDISNKIAAMSLDGLKGSLRPFDFRIHALRPHHGQRQIAEQFLQFFSSGDEIQDSHKNCKKVQDPYSFRCIPQVHGASLDTVNYVEKIFTTELGSVTDNPLVFLDGDIISGGNFHGQPLALGMDFLAIAIAEIASISERRIEKLTNPHMSGLNPFLVSESGLHSGMMIPHVVAAALVSENKVLCHPASVDTIPTSADKEDHVSMGALACMKARQVLENAFHVLAIEVLCACQALDLHKPLKPSRQISAFYEEIRAISPSLHNDRSLSHDIKSIASALISGYLLV